MINLKFNTNDTPELHFELQAVGKDIIETLKETVFFEVMDEDTEYKIARIISEAFDAYGIQEPQSISVDFGDFDKAVTIDVTF